MASTGERAVGGVTRGLIGPGEHVIWRATHLGVSQTLESRITAFDRPAMFAYEQVRGAFAWFRHEHRFERRSPTITRMTDEFRFRAPLGPLGTLAERWFLTGYMTDLLHARGLELKRALEGDGWRPFLAGAG